MTVSDNHVHTSFSSDSKTPMEDMLRQAASMAVCKINIDSDLRLAMTASVREHLYTHPDHFDPRQYLKPGREAIKQMVMHKIQYVLGCENKA